MVQVHKVGEKVQCGRMFIFAPKNNAHPFGGVRYFVPVKQLSLLCVSLDVENLFAIVKAANLADAMVLHERVTSRVGALCHARHRELAVVGASLVSACFRYLLLRYCHIYTSSCTVRA